MIEIDMREKEIREKNVQGTGSIPVQRPICDVRVKSSLIGSDGTLINAGTETSRRVSRYLGTVSLTGIIIDDVKIPEGFKEIKSIDRKVRLTQCKLINDQLFVEGVIIKNVTYVLPEYGQEHCQASRNMWKDIDVEVPFSLNMRVEGLPSYGLMYSYKLKGNYKCNTMKDKCCDRGTIEVSPCESIEDQFVYLNDVPYCDLEAFRISEVDINREGCHGGHGSKDLYHTLTEKIILDLIISIYVDELVLTGAGTTETSNEEACTNR